MTERSDAGRFAAGRSGNPGGRPRVVAELRELAQAEGSRVIARLVEIAMGKDPKASVAACRELLDRGFGKATQPVDGDGEGGPVQLVVKWQDPVPR